MNDDTPSPLLRSHRAKRILIVDDDPRIRRIVSLALTSAGYAVTIASSGHEAITQFESESALIDLVITDVIMPHLSGRQLASRVVALKPGINVLLMSGYPGLTRLFDGIAGRSEAIKADCYFLQKPFSPADLIKTVGEILQGPKSASSA